MEAEVCCMPYTIEELENMDHDANIEMIGRDADFDLGDIGNK